MKEKYTGAIVKLIEKPIKTILFSCLILIAGIVLSGVVGKDFLPELDEGSIWLQVNLPPGISVEKSREMSDTLRSRTMKYPEVTYIMVQAGEMTTELIRSPLHILKYLSVLSLMMNGRKEKLKRI